MMHSFLDHKTHEFFTERDYPDPELLEVAGLLESMAPPLGSPPLSS